MKIDCLAGGAIATIQIRNLRTGRFEMLVEKFSKISGAEYLACGILEAPQLRQLAKEILQLTGDGELAAQIPRFQTHWGC